jgi:hypothetical protein
LTWIVALHFFERTCQLGAFNQTTAQDAVNSTRLIIDNSTNSINNNTNANDAQSSPSSSSGITPIDSGFIQQGQWFQYSFNEAEVFNYLCTIHAEEGMRGTLIIAAAPTSSHGLCFVILVG